MAMRRVSFKAADKCEDSFDAVVRPRVNQLARFGECQVGLLLPTATLAPEALDTMELQLGVRILGARTTPTGVMVEARARLRDVDRLGGVLFSVDIFVPVTTVASVEQTFLEWLQDSST